jgi:membrane protein implicated in regulation of membrane protease activity
MEDSQNIPASSPEGTATPPPGNPVSPIQSGGETPDEGSKSNRGRAIIIGIVLVVILAILIAAFVLLLRAAPGVTSQIRDVFIIFMALEALVIGVALVILVVQLAVLINLLQNEIKPILNSTNETVSTLRGTITFLSNNLTEPVIKVNSYVAGAKKLVDLVRPGRR